jgi:hypothetical protein
MGEFPDLDAPVRCPVEEAQDLVAGGGQVEGAEDGLASG